MTGTTAACAAGIDSQYLALSKDAEVAQPNLVLLSASVSGNQEILITSDGSFRPHKGCFAGVFITVDGKKVSNDGAIDWRSSKFPAAHSFKCIAAVRLSAANHTVALVADGSDGFVVSGSSNLCIMTQPAAKINSETLRENSAVISMNRPSQIGKGDPITFVPILDLHQPKSFTSSVVLASGSVFAGEDKQNWGDAMWGLFADGQELGNNNATYADNDICSHAEFRGPVFVQGFLENGAENVSLAATALPWDKKDGTFNQVRFQSTTGSKLIVLTGNMKVAGHVAVIQSSKESTEHNSVAYQCVGSSQNWKGCSCAGTDAVVARAVINVPKDHNGVVYLSAMTRAQGAAADKGGAVRLWLTVDGKKKGSTGFQLLREHDCISQRTLSASYLAAGNERLSPGDHVVELRSRATGDFIHLCVTRNMPLMWFD